MRCTHWNLNESNCGHGNRGVAGEVLLLGFFGFLQISHVFIKGECNSTFIVLLLTSKIIAFGISNRAECTLEYNSTPSQASADIADASPTLVFYFFLWGQFSFTSKPCIRG
ncbi:hypothetical protein CEXT_50611 [Caerostris extrusa]|uniref:Uncharacterized protein n=1 Tax=Caerostris extrusa TaxID=172846 RepID=A0AAV4X379_CAEEX|nr:hypothetical protein CEXT_50611 [Caerostris extrusa]